MYSIESSPKRCHSTLAMWALACLVPLLAAADQTESGPELSPLPGLATAVAAFARAPQHRALAVSAAGDGTWIVGRAEAKSGALQASIEALRSCERARQGASVAAPCELRRLNDHVLQLGATLNEVAPDTPAMIWRVTRRASSAHNSGNGPTVYLLGTVHVFRASLLPLPQAMTLAMADADRLVVELDISNLDPAAVGQAVTQHGLLPNGVTAADVLPPAAITRLRATAAHLGVPWPGLARLRTAMIGVELGMAQAMAFGYLPEQGLDRVLLNIAAGRNLPIDSLETIDQQLRALAASDDGDWNEADELQLADMTHPRLLEQTIAAWTAGDAELLYSLNSAGMTPTALWHLLAQRNQHMATRIAQYLAEDSGDKNTPQPDAMKAAQRLPDTATTVVAVGAAHLGGDAGLLELLSQEFDVIQLRQDGAPCARGLAEREGVRPIELALMD